MHHTKLEQHPMQISQEISNQNGINEYVQHTLYQQNMCLVRNDRDTCSQFLMEVIVQILIQI